MARRRRRSAPRRRRRNPVRVARRRRRSVFRSAPRRRVRRRRSYRRNPGTTGSRGIVGQIQDLGIGAGVGLLGMAAGRTVGNMIPFGAGDPVMTFVKQTAIAIGIRVFGAKVLGNDLARIAAIGAMLNPTKDLVVSLVPQAATFLGASPMALPGYPRSIAAYSRPSVGSYSGLNGYLESADAPAVEVFQQ